MLIKYIIFPIGFAMVLWIVFSAKKAAEEMGKKKKKKKWTN